MDKKNYKDFLNKLDIEHPLPVCPIKDVLAIMMDKWIMLIILFLGKYGKMRFAELRRNVHGISPKMLTKSLRLLERDGHVTRSVFPEVPIRVEYELTKQGEDFLYKVADMADWIMPYMPTIEKNRAEFEK